MIRNKDRCSKCGESWKDATFLSETFDYDGVNMVFQCRCGNETKRTFLPTDIMSVEDFVYHVLKQEGVDDSVLRHFMERQFIIKFGKKTT